MDDDVKEPIATEAKVRKEVEGLKMPENLLKEIRLINKKIDLSREAVNVTGKDPNFYSGALNNLAELELAKDEWSAKVVEINEGKIPPNAFFNANTGTFFVEE